MKTLTFSFSSQDPGMVVHTVNENTQAVEVGRCLKFKTILIFIMRSVTVRATECNPVSNFPTPLSRLS